MLTGQFPPSTALQQPSSNAVLAINGNLKDEQQLITIESALDSTATSTATTTAATTATTTATTAKATTIHNMTKQLTTNSATTISNGSLAPTSGGNGSSGGISPLTSPASNATSPHAGVGVSRKSGSTTATVAPLSTKPTPTAAVPPLTAATTATTTSTTSAAAAAAAAANDASGRSAALERAYVHDVYEHCEEPTGPIRPRVAQFLSNLDAGSVVCDVGCGSGRYLTQCNPAICTIGVDRCYRLSKVAREKGGEVTLCDNLELPFRDESFDAVLSLAVVHHFATTERRVSALRELARILRIGGRVVITVWALEQRHRRFESQDVLIPWQPPKNRNISNSDEEDDDSFLPPYHAYTEDSTNSSRSAGDGDSSSLSSSSPGESCYSFVRRAIQKLAGGRKHPWFLDSWTSKETKNDSSLDYEDAKDLPIELRRLEDFEDFPDPPLSAGLKSRSLGSILNPPPRQIVRSRSSVPSLGGALLHMEPPNFKSAGISTQNAQFLSTLDGHSGTTAASVANGHSPTGLALGTTGVSSLNGVNATSSLGRRPKLIKQKQSLCDEDYQLPENPFHMISSYNSNSNSVSSSLYLRSGCYYSSTHTVGGGGSGGGGGGGGAGGGGGGGASHHHHAAHHQVPLTARQMMQASIFLRKQSSLNEELMAGNRIREKERVRKRIQKQISLNEAFLCRSALFSKRLQVIREGFASKIKNSTGSLERATKNGLTKIIQNFKVHTAPTSADSEMAAVASMGQNGDAHGSQQSQKCPKHQHYHHHHHHYHHQQLQQPAQQSHHTHFHQSQSTSTGTVHYPYTAIASVHKQMSLSGGSGSGSVSDSGSGSGSVNTKFSGPVTYCNSPDCGSAACYCSTYHHVGCSGCCATEGECQEAKARRHSRESGSDSSKDSSLQSDTSIESEDSFASVIFIPKPEQHQQQLNYQQQHQNSNSSSSNSSSSNGGSAASGAVPSCQHKCCTCMAHMNGHPHQHQLHHHQHQHQSRLPSLPTSPLIMPCPPTPAHSPAAAQATITSPPQTMAAVTAAMAILTPPFGKATVESTNVVIGEGEDDKRQRAEVAKSRFNFDEAHIKQHESQQQQSQKFQSAASPKADVAPIKVPLATALRTVPVPTAASNSRITRQSIRDLPPIPKFRKQQSLQLHRQSFPIVRRSSATASSAAAVAIPHIPKLLSLELFNPATDDLDSDSSEASSPDSIDSVISAAKSTATTQSSTATTTVVTSELADMERCASVDEHGHDIAELAHISAISVKQQQYRNGDLKINPATPHDIILNDDSCHLLPTHSNGHQLSSKKPQDCAEFAQQLSAQLLREIEDKHSNVECRSLDGIGDIADFLEEPGSGGGGSSGGGNGNGNGSGSGGHKKRNGDLRDLSALREELRERRLMLANLSTQPSLQQSPTSSSSSLSSQTRSFTIHEENEEENDERSYTLQLYENCKISKFNYKRNRHYNLNPETAYLLQDDGDIFEEDEEEVEEQESGDGENEELLCEGKNSRNTIRCESWEEDEEAEGVAQAEEGETSEKRHVRHAEKHSKRQQQCRHHGDHTHALQNRQSTESWENSNSSTNSLDSPSQGGATTHHRYYHVFREGELDALINHHVASLHIVSSYYERASWCVVAEKVQVWTI